MRLRVLGTLEVRVDGVVLSAGSRKQQTVLGLLAVNAGRSVSLPDLIDELWPDNPPASAAPNVRSYTARLRRLFAAVEPGRDRLARRGSSYMLHADPEELDLSVFTAQIAAARDALRRDEPKLAAAGFGEALACWRGPMLAGLPRGPILAARCVGVEEERLATVEDLAAVLLRLGEPAEAVALLREHVLTHALRERGHVLLMRALYSLDDVAGALAAYAAGRDALREQLGMEPGTELRELHRAILNRTVLPEPAPPGVVAVTAPAPRIPAQLPLDVRGFTGRGTELAELDAILALSGAWPSSIVITSIAGTPGVGKTALAVHWAHRVREEFPDGQLYVNLRGYDPGSTVMSPAEAVRGFLDALDVAAARIPTDLRARTALYRSLLATRRMLVVLDNARDAEQVRPLLPGSSGCFVVVTSRNQLTSLVAAEGARPMILDLLPGAEAQTLLERRIGAGRVAAEPEAAEEIVTRCARLPLALVVVAARAATRSRLPLAALAGELRDGERCLDALDGGDVTADARAAFSWSYRTLSPAAARLFRLLALPAGPDISAAATASLAGAPIAQVRRTLTELTRAHLITEHLPGRYACHDLLRAYATELAHAHDSDADRRTALRRVLDHYLHSAYSAALAIYPQRDRIPLAPIGPGVTPEGIAGEEQAAAWFTAERAVLLTSVDRAADTGFEVHAWQLAWTLVDFLQREGHWQDQITSQEAALNATIRRGDQLGQAHTHRALARAHARRGCPDTAYIHYRHALDVLTALGDRDGQVQTLRGLAWACFLQDRKAESLSHALQALELSRAIGDRTGQADALNTVGYCHAQLGEHTDALLHSQQALELYQQLGDRSGQADAWHSIGYAHHHLGRFTEAVESYALALSLYRDIGHHHYEAVTFSHLGDTRQAVDDRKGARDAWLRALEILNKLHHPDADEVRTKLRQLDQRGGPVGPESAHDR